MFVNILRKRLLSGSLKVINLQFVDRYDYVLDVNLCNRYDLILFGKIQRTQLLLLTQIK